MAAVKTLPETWPALRMLAISAGLLKSRRSFMMGFRGLTSLDLRILAKPSDFVEGPEKKREKADPVGGFEARSV